MKYLQENYYNKFYSNETHKLNDIPDWKITNNQKVKHKRILVYAIGAGSDIRHLISENEVWGVDISLAGLNRLKLTGIKIIKTDLNLACKTIPSNYFDIVIAKDILEHLESPSTLATEIHRVLKSTGYAVISVPNHFNLFSRVQMLLGKNIIWKSLGHDHTKEFEEWNYMHRVFFTWGGFKKFLTVHQLKLSKTFWDFGTLSHYSQPEMVIRYMENKQVNANIVQFVRKTWIVFNVIFPRKIRAMVVGASPSVFCAGFYVWCKKLK